jgi:hypothetical protein
MADSRFWKALAVLSVLAAFYVGHGLHERTGLAVPSFVNQARAEGVAIQRGTDAPCVAVTCSQDGRTVYYYGPQELSPTYKNARYLGSISAK